MTKFHMGEGDPKMPDAPVKVFKNIEDARLAQKAAIDFMNGKITEQEMKKAFETATWKSN